MVLRVVHLEDDPADRELVADMLQGDRIDCTIVPVASRDTFEAAIAEPTDLILSDYAIPGFDGGTAQAIARTQCPDVPFVFVSGSIGEQEAIERLKTGATDYVLKDRLDKLPSAVRRALREAEDRRERAAAEAALRQLNAELEARVEERTRALVESNEALRLTRAEAERANRAKSEFLSRMSHDLRTPLNAIMGFAQVLQLDPLPPDQADSVNQIYRAGEHLLALINEVLDLARIEAGHLTLSTEPVSIGQNVAGSIAIIQPLAAQRGITVAAQASDALYARTDPRRLSQILLNLLSNAVKYNRPEGTIRVVAQRQFGTMVRIDVIDTGPGMAQDKLALAFEPFERLGAEASAVEGTGLGLAVSRRLAEAMGGSLSAESIVDQGTTMTLLLPEDDAPGGTTLPDGSQAPATVAGTVLYVEDSAPNVQLIRRVLERRPGILLRHAPDGATALGMIRADPPDLVLLDLHLTDMSGAEVVRQIWEQSATRRIPVAVLSGDATIRSQRHLLAAGAIRYLTKPFAVADILQLVDDVLRRRP